MCNNVYVCVCGVRACAYNNNILPFRIFKVLYAMDGGRRVNEYPIKLRQKKKHEIELKNKAQTMDSKMHIRTQVCSLNYYG